MQPFLEPLELLDIVDEQGVPTGETVTRARAHEEGIRHRCISRPAMTKVLDSPIRGTAAP